MGGWTLPTKDFQPTLLLFIGTGTSGGYSFRGTAHTGLRRRLRRRDILSRRMSGPARCSVSPPHTSISCRSIRDPTLPFVPVIACGPPLPPRRHPTVARRRRRGASGGGGGVARAE